MDAQQRWQDSEERGRQFENVSEHDDRAPYRERDGGQRGEWQRGEWQQGEWQQGERQQNRWQQDEDGGHGLSTALGWLSIGLGLAQIAQPRRVAQIIGVQDDSDTRAVIRAVGVREIATGIGLLAQPQNPGWLKARVCELDTVNRLQRLLDSALSQISAPWSAAIARSTTRASSP